AKVSSRPLHRPAYRGRARHRHRLHDEILDHGYPGKNHRPLQLFGGYGYMEEYPISHMLSGCPGHAHLRRHQRDHERADRAEPVVLPPGGSPMTDAFIYDHVRTPRGRGKPDGALHEVTALDLATHALAAIKDRNALERAPVDAMRMR